MISSSFIGQVFQMIRVGDLKQGIHLEACDSLVSSSSRMENLDETKPSDVVLLRSADPEQAPGEHWRQVRKVLAVLREARDRALLTPYGVGFRRITKPNNLSIEPGSVVERSDVQGVLGVVSGRPIQSGPLGYSNEGADDLLRTAVRWVINFARTSGRSQ